MPGNCGNTGRVTVAPIKAWRDSPANTPQPLTSWGLRVESVFGKSKAQKMAYFFVLKYGENEWGVLAYSP